MRYTNELINETSPYLLQHAHNPVNWLPFGGKVFEIAQKQDKPIIFSIGYSACHWCHVMEKESFENEEVANLMNAHFVCVKVDREERPDVDHIYMDAVQLLNGNGGWPLNCFALPDGRPFWGGTYFRAEQWLHILQQIHELYQNKKNEILAQAEELSHHVNSTPNLIDGEVLNCYTNVDFDKAFQQLHNSFDHENGGMYGAPKFPMPVVFEFLLAYASENNHKKAWEMLEKTLLFMAKGGIYDQIGGGFARYSTDKIWKAPHFEKMLYDNAQLVSLYAKTYKVNKNPFYKQIVEETLDFVKREMTSPDGFFYSALDADSEGEEGLFYTYTQQDFDSALGEYANLISDYYQLKNKGLWENGKSILMAQHDEDAFAQQQCLSTKELTSVIEFSKNKLMKLRMTREKPKPDDKMLLSWNSLMCKAYIDAYVALDNETYLQTALKCMDFVMNNLKQVDGSYLHTYKNGKANINAFLDDYAFFADALLLVYVYTAAEKYLYEAKRVADYVIDSFYDKNSGFFYFSAPAKKNMLFANKIETYDGVTPSGNSQMASVLYHLSVLCDNSSYSEICKQMTSKMFQRIEQHPSAYAKWAKTALVLKNETTVIAVVGENAQTILKELSKEIKSDVFLCASQKSSELPYIKARYEENLTLIYICRGSRCLLPVETIAEALKILSS